MGEKQQRKMTIKKINILFFIILVFLYMVALLLYTRYTGSMSLKEFMEMFLGGLLSTILPLIIFNLFYEYLTREYYTDEVSEQIVDSIVLNRQLIDAYSIPVKKNFIRYSTQSILGEERGEILYSSIIDPYLDNSISFRRAFRYYITYDEIKDKNLLPGQKLLNARSEYFWVYQDLSFIKLLKDADIKRVKVGFALSEETLRDWFDDDNDFLFREIINLNEADREIIQNMSQDQIETFISEVMNLKIYINDTECSFDNIFLANDKTGFIIETVPSPLLNGNKELKFRISFGSPHNKSVNNFMVVISEPTDSVNIQFRYIRDAMKVKIISFFDERKEPYIEHVVGDTIRVELDNWVFPRSGVVFHW